jgi:hypothetical protein
MRVLALGPVFLVVSCVGAGLSLGGSPQTLRDFFTDLLKHRTSQHQ